MKPIAIITGASSGLGYILGQYMEEHYTVMDWSLETGVDLRLPEIISEAALRAIAKYQHIDVLVNCAGVNQPMDYIQNLRARDWDDMFAVNARAIFLCTKFLAHAMRGSTICNIISSAAVQPMTCSLPYNASKAAAAMMTRQMARELIKTHDITVFGVSPNWMKNTPMTAETNRRVRALRDLTEEQLITVAAQGRLTADQTDPQAVAEFVSWLLAEKPRHISLAGSILEYGI